MKAMTSGIMPTREEFEAHWDNIVGEEEKYEYVLRGVDAKCASRAGVASEDTVRSAQMYNIIEKLVELDDDDALSLAGGFLHTLGFEWI